MRALRITAIAVLVLLVLAVAADRIAVHVVQNQAAARLDGHYRLKKPKVEVNGFPFLTQVAAMKFDDVQLSSGGASVAADGKTLTLAHMSVHLHGVRPESNYQHATIDEATGSAVLSYRDFNMLMDDDSTAVSYGGRAGGHGRLKFTTSKSLLGHKQKITGTARVLLGKDGRTISSGDVQLNGPQIPLISGLIEKKFAVKRKFTELPVNLELSSIEPEADGVHIGLAGGNLRI